MWSLMAACDVLVNLRYPTMGETSGSVIRALSLGRPLIVSDVGWFSELPDDVVLKVPVDEYEVATLEAALDARRRSRRGARRERARATSSGSMRSRRVADRYVGGARDGCRRRRGRRRGAPADRRGGGARSGSTTPARSRAPRSTPGSSREAAGRRCLRGSGWRRSSSLSAAVARRARAADAGAVDHGRRADLLRAREVGRARTGSFLVRGVPSSGYGFVYPVLIAPAFRPACVGARTRTPAAKVINACVMSLAAIPTYFLARRLLEPGAVARRRRARGRDPVDALHGHADDGERVLPGLRARSAACSC